MDAWKIKANELIYKSCKVSYMQANYRNGKKLARFVPYSVPSLAQDLIDCLNRNDEETAKAIFLSYDGMKLI